MKIKPKFLEYIYGSNTLTNIPYITWLTNSTIDEMGLTYVTIRMKDPSDHTRIDSLAEALTEALADLASV